MYFFMNVFIYVVRVVILSVVRYFFIYLCIPCVIVGFMSFILSLVI